MLLGIISSGFAPVQAADFNIADFSRDQQGRLVLRHDADPAYYYILYRGTQVTEIVSAVDMALGVPVEGQLADEDTAAAAAFYRVRQVPIASPLDTDGDGIDDVWELRFRRRGAALNGQDALEDHTGSGVPDLTDYELPVAYFAQSASTTLVEDAKILQLSVQYSRDFFGQAIVMLGGSAVPGVDFTISGLSTNQTARVTAAGRQANFTITLKDAPSIDPDRFLLLSIVEPAVTNTLPQRYRTSVHAPLNHTLRITEGDLGLYTGLLEFPDGAASGVHPLRLAVRSVPGGGAVAYLDATLSPLLGRAFTLPALVSAEDGGLAGLPQPLLHQTQAAALQRTLNYTFQFDGVSRTNDLFEAPVNLQLHGLSSSGKQVTSRGTLRLIRLAND